jgi:hypothetical protein
LSAGFFLTSGFLVGEEEAESADVVDDVVNEGMTGAILSFSSCTSSCEAEVFTDAHSEMGGKLVEKESSAVEMIIILSALSSTS